MEVGTIVVNKSGLKGIVVPDPFHCCGANEVPVVYEGSSEFYGTDVEELDIIGPENAQADPEKCGAGKGEKCCIFLTWEASGFKCERFSSLRHNLILRKSQMTSKREPVEFFPNCQLS